MLVYMPLIKLNAQRKSRKKKEEAENGMPDKGEGINNIFGLFSFILSNNFFCFLFQTFIFLPT